MRPLATTLLLLGAAVGAQELAPTPIDLPSVLKLAGAQGIEIEIAEAKLREARANEDGSLWQFFPVIAPGIGYMNHTGQAQSFAGSVSDINKQSTIAGATVLMKLEIGEAIYHRLAAKQIAVAAEQNVAAQRRQTTLQASLSYFDLAKAHHAVRLHEEALKVAKDYHDQIARGVQAGVAFKGDELRADAQVTRQELRLSQAKDARRAEAAHLAQILRLKITESLTPADDHPLALTFVERGRKLDDFVQNALQKRPELLEAGALHEAARHNDDAATYAPLYPTLGAQVFAGGLGGSTSSARQDFGNSTDTMVTLTWKIGAGGLFDSSRTEGAQARLKQTQLQETRTREDIIRQVVEAQSHVQYLDQQLKVAAAGVRAAEQGLMLSLARREFSVGIVLEALQSQQDLIQARLDYAGTIAELNKAQVRLKSAAGE